MPAIGKNYNISAFSDLLSGLHACWKRKIRNISLFATNRCNSRCRICHIWKETPKRDLEPEAVRNMLDSKTISRKCYVGLVGGEFLLHPHYEEIIKTVRKRTRNYTLYSNGILSDRVIDAVEKFGIPNLQISLDGTRETYRKVRGVDTYDSAIKVIENLRDKTKIGIIYTMNPLNTRKDFIHVLDIAKKNNVSIGVGVYDRREMFHTELDKGSLYGISDVFQTNFLKSYGIWAKEGLKLPCFSIRNNLTVLSNGDVPLCQNKNAIMGNLYKESIEAIWKRMIPVQDENKNCNGCWLTCHRGFDNNACKLLNTILPEFALNRLIGKYDWKKLGGF